MTNENAILLLHTLRTGYICDPNECKFTKGDENCVLCECDNYHDALALAIECIEKQIPKKPILIEDKMYVCASCGNNLQFKYKKYPDELNGKGFNYCMCCGQRQDWREVELCQ